MHAALTAFVALSQPAVGAPAPASEAPPAPATESPPAPASEAPPAPATEAPPAWVLPPMPDPNADYSVDAALFTEVATEPERARRAALEASLRPADRRPPLYARAPALTLLTQSVAGVFGGGVLGLMGGSVGQAIEPGDRQLPLGGPHGPLFGGLAGTLIGTTGAVYGAGSLFGKDADRLGWTSLGAGIGTVLGAGAAAGFAAGLDKGDTASTLAVTSFVVLQVAGAVAFDTLFQAPPPPVPATVAPLPSSEDEAP